ncbi:MFS transporter [Streptomyces hayashii]|uniref:MFS transporter n=1 Tax=Streptomyces hayashii TaxID=2839966 RepID=UPI00403C4DED
MRQNRPFRGLSGTGPEASLSQQTRNTECFARYAEVRQTLAGGGMDRLPQDPRKLREWDMVMSVVGSLTAIDRPLIPAGAEVLIHGSGADSEDEFESPDRTGLHPVESPETFPQSCGRPHSPSYRRRMPDNIPEDPMTTSSSTPQTTRANRRPLYLLASSLFAVRLAAVVTSVALPLLVIHRYGVGLDSGLTAALELLPNFLFGPFAGEIVDRRNPRTIAAVCALVGAPIVALFPFTHSLWQIQLLGLASGLTYTAGVPARMALRGQAIAKGHELSGNSLLVLAQRLPTLIGPAAAALAVQIGYSAVFVANAVVCLSAALLVIRVPLRPDEPAEQGSHSPPVARNIVAKVFKQSLPELGRSIGGNPGLAALTVIGCTYMFSSYGMGKFFLAGFSAHYYSRDGSFFGYLVAAMGLGAVAGSVLAPRFRKFRQGVVFVACGLVESLAWSSYAVQHNRIVALSAAAVVGICESVGAVVYYSEIQTRLPDRLVGRYFSFYIALGDGLNVLGSMTIGIVVSSSVSSGALLTAGAVCIPLLVLCPLFLLQRFWRADDWTPAAGEAR